MRYSIGLFTCCSQLIHILGVLLHHAFAGQTLCSAAQLLLTALPDCLCVCCCSWHVCAGLCVPRRQASC